MITRLRNAFRRVKKSSAYPALRFDRPLVLLQSDDWGRAGVRDREGWEELRAGGLNLGERPYDSYSLETAEDVHALGEVLRKHRDSIGRSPSMVMNFIMANVDFDRVEPGQRQIPLRPLTAGLPGMWRRPQLLEAYQDGIRERLFYPALHGLTHFCERAVARELAATGERSRLVKNLWKAQTPYIHWRMPWIGFEYWDPEMPAGHRFLSLNEQRVAIARATEIFQQIFAASPSSACAPGYRANQDTKTAWFESGVRVSQNGPGHEPRGPYLDENGMLFTFRTLEMEPAVAPCDLAKLLRQVEVCFARGLPAVISIHAINFHSTIQDFRTPTLKLMDEFLSTLENRWPDLLYLHDGDLFSIATGGFYAGESGRARVAVISAEAGK
jgi:hypothetical protein